MFFHFGSDVGFKPCKHVSSWRVPTDPEVQEEWTSYRRALRPLNSTPFILFSSAAVPTLFMGWSLCELFCVTENMPDFFTRNRMIYLFLSTVRIVPAWIFAFVVYFGYENKVNFGLQKISTLIGLNGIKRFVSLDSIVLITAVFSMGSTHVLKSLGGECSDAKEFNYLCTPGHSKGALPFDSYGIIIILPLLLQVFHKGSCFTVVLIAWLMMSISVLLSLYIVGEKKYFIWFQQFFILFNIYGLLTQNENLLENCFKMKLEQENLIRSSLAAENETALMDMQANEIR